MESSRGKILDRAELKKTLDALKRQGRKVVFTNGCFDLLHPGHVRYLERARSLGDVLVVGLNSDASTRALKGPGRPILNQDERSVVLAALASVGFVTVFDEETPLRIVQELVPDVLVKGGDWAPDRIVGRDVVESSGGRVHSIEYEAGNSTTALIDRIRHDPED